LKEEECQKCGGTGWETKIKEEREIAVRCDCTLKKNISRKAEHANLPLRFYGGTLAWSYKPNEKCPSQFRALKKAQKFVRDYPSVQQGYLFQGSIGLGKTALLCIIGYELITTKNTDVYYIDWNDLVREMRSGEDHSQRDFGVINQLVTRLCDTEVLLFDELGASTVSPWVQDNIYYIINRRYNNKKVTLCATNYQDLPADGKETLSQRVGERVRSRLFEMTEYIEIKGPDFRRTTLGGNSK